jgi:hypothetical protein
VDFGLPELTEEQIEEVCAVAEDAARKYIFSKVNAKMVENLDISVEAEGSKPVNLTIEVVLVLLPEAKLINEKALAGESVKEAFKAIENYLRKLT